MLSNHTPKERRCIDRRFDGPKHSRTRDYDSDGGGYGGGFGDFMGMFGGGSDPDGGDY